MPPQVPPPPPPPPQSPGGRSNTVALVVVWGLVAWVLVVGGVVLVTRGGDDADGDGGQQAGGVAGEGEQDLSSGADPEGTAGTDNLAGGGVGSGAGRQAYVDEIVAGMDDDPELVEMFTPAEMECWAGGLIDAWGLPAVQAAGTPAEVVAAFEADDTESIGLAMDQAWDGAVWDNISTCMDLRQLFRDLAESDPLLTAEEREAFVCIIDNLTDDELRNLFVDGLFADDPAAVDAALERAALECMVPDTGDMVPVAVTD